MKTSSTLEGTFTMWKLLIKDKMFVCVEVWAGKIQIHLILNCCIFIVSCLIWITSQLRTETASRWRRGWIINMLFLNRLLIWLILLLIVVWKDCVRKWVNGIGTRGCHAVRASWQGRRSSTMEIVIGLESKAYRFIHFTCTGRRDLALEHMMA